MLAKGDWDKVDPRDAQLIVLLTKIKVTFEQQTKLLTPDKWKNIAPSYPDANKNRYEEWQLKKVGDTKVINGKTWCWYPQPQHNEGKGLYVCYPPGDHDKWLHPKRKCMTILGGH